MDQSSTELHIYFSFLDTKWFELYREALNAGMTALELKNKLASQSPATELFGWIYNNLPRSQRNMIMVKAEDLYNRLALVVEQENTTTCSVIDTLFSQIQNLEIQLCASKVMSGFVNDVQPYNDINNSDNKTPATVGTSEDYIGLTEAKISNMWSEYFRLRSGMQNYLDHWTKFKVNIQFALMTYNDGEGVENCIKVIDTIFNGALVSAIRPINLRCQAGFMSNAMF